jgi:TPR repeat protein
MTNVLLVKAIWMLNLITDYYKLAAIEGQAVAQFTCALLLVTGDGILLNNLLAAGDFKLAADQGHSDARSRYETLVVRTDRWQPVGDFHDTESESS